jgi:anthranilate phosphoribosyltransferase
MTLVEVTWKVILGLLANGSDLTHDQAAWAMEDLMSGNATDSQIAAFAMGLRVKGETPIEIIGLVDMMMKHSVRVNLDRHAVDVVGTGGDGANTVNISTMAALTVAGCGVPVLKHGNRAVSSKSGTADVLEALGVAITMPPILVSSAVAEAGIGFCMAPAHHPALRYAATVRKELAVPTVFNVLGPLANPGQPQAALIGVADAKLAPVLAQVQLQRNKSSILVRSDDGLDEISTVSTTRAWDVTSGLIREEVLDPKSFGITPAYPDQLRGDDAKYNAQIVRAILAGRTDGDLQAIRDVVALNAAAALVAYDAATARGNYGLISDSLTSRMSRALPMAYRALDSGAAESVLDLWVSVSQRYALSGSN